MNKENRDCNLCKKQYEDDGEEYTITFLKGALGIGSGTEYVVCPKCYDKWFERVKKGGLQK